VARLVLVGLPGVGKTTIAKELAHRWECEALDTDDVFLSREGLSPAAFLRAHDEPSFRLQEVDALAAALASDGVVATGGGVVCTQRGRDLLTREVTLWLDCDDDVILSRLDEIDRPLLSDKPAASIARLRYERSPWYDEVSKARVDTAGPIDLVVRGIVDEATRLTQ
jgi:shikimate kinase